MPQGACKWEKHSVVEYHQSVKNKWFYGGKTFNFTKMRQEKVQVIKHLEGWDSGILKRLLSASLLSDLDDAAQVFQFLSQGLRQ